MPKVKALGINNILSRRIDTIHECLRMFKENIIIKCFIMKKLSLKKLKLESSDLLQRNELKSVFGGYDGGYDSGWCSDTCTGDSDCNSGGMGTQTCGLITCDSEEVYACK